MGIRQSIRHIMVGKAHVEELTVGPDIDVAKTLIQLTQKNLELERRIKALEP